MNELNPAHTLLVNIIERVDEQGELLTFDERRSADELLEGDHVGCPSQGISERTRVLMALVEQRAPLLAQLVSHARSTVKLTQKALLALSLLCGLGAQSLGSQGVFHVLSPVLCGLILWNMLSLTLLFLFTARRSQAHVDESPHQAPLRASSRSWRGVSRLIELSSLSYKRLKRFGYSSTAELQQRVAQSYLKAFGEHFQPVMTAELKRTLHASAALFAVGALTNAYWTGLAHAYHVTAESTFLSPALVSQLAHLILTPAQLLMGNLPQLTADAQLMTLGGSSHTTYGLAAPWVNAYAVSLMIWVILPRFMLALKEHVTLKRAHQNVSRQLSCLDSLPTLNIALASHTNIGKTSLARTLLRRDVGEVRDAEHVTQHRASYFLVGNSEVRLRLWDTPGFGDPAPLMSFIAHAQQRLSQASQTARLRQPPLRLSSLIQTRTQARTQARRGPFRFTSRADEGLSESGLTHLDIEALRALEEEADLILYVVAANPSEEQLEQTRAELALLALLHQPVLLLVNRLTEALHDSTAEAQREHTPQPDHHLDQAHDPLQTELIKNTEQERYRAVVEQSIALWRQRLEELAASGELLPKRLKLHALDAFQRTYQDERDLYKAISELLEGDKAQLAERLFDVWESRQRELHSAIAHVIGQCVQDLSELSLTIKSGGFWRGDTKKKTNEDLQKLTAKRISEARERLLDLIGLEGRARQEGAKFALGVMVVLGDRKERRKWGAVLGALISGVLTGLGADLMTGGLSLGGGMLVGGFLGVLGGIGIIEGYDYVTQHDQRLSLNKEALRLAFSALLLFTLGASAHGRAQGSFEEQRLEEAGDQASSSVYITMIAQRCREVVHALEEERSAQLNQLMSALSGELEEPHEAAEPLSVEQAVQELTELVTYALSSL